MSGKEMIKESFLLLEGIGRNLTDYYNQGVIDLERYNLYKYNLRIYWLVYSKYKGISELFSSYDVSGFAKQVILIKRLMLNRDFERLDSMCKGNIESEKKLEVKCAACRKKETFVNQGFVLDDKYNVHNLFRGSWVCSTDCLRQIEE